MSLEQLLSEIRQRRLILTSGHTGRVVLWSPCTTVSRQIRQAIAYHNLDLQRVEIPAVTEHGNVRIEVLWLNRKAFSSQQGRLFDIG